MKSERSILQIGLIFLFGGFTCSSLLGQFSPKALFLPLVLVIFIFLFRKTNSIQLICNLIISSQLASAITHFFSNLTVLWFSIFILALFTLLSSVSILYHNSKFVDSITNCSLSLGVAYVLIMNVHDHLFFDYIALSYPFVTAFIYIILSNKATYGINILASNISITLLISYFLKVIFPINIEPTLLVISWISILLISLLSNGQSNLGFKLYYRRFQKKRRHIKADIFTMRKQIEKANNLSNEELYRTISSFRNINMEYKLTSLLSGNISRFNLQTKVNDMKTIGWFLVFVSYLVVSIVILYAFNIEASNYGIILLSATIAYLILAPYVIMYILKNRMVRYINSTIIYPINNLIAERNELIEMIEQILHERGFTNRRLEEYDDMHFLSNNVMEDQQEISGSLNLIKMEI